MKISTAPLPRGSQVRALLTALLLILVTAIGTLAPASTAVAASAPGAPTGVVGIAKDRSVALSWVAPASNGGRSITGYRVRYSTNNGSSWSSSRDTNSTTTQYTLTQLTNGRSYVFQVRATNRVGSGSWSVTSGPVTPEAASPPPPPPPPVTGFKQSIAVPSYFYPGSSWTQLEAGAPTVGLAIINPNSGPGDTVDSNYVSQVTSTRAKGMTVIGYVHTSYGARSLTEVKAEVDRHYTWYGVDGIFFDEVTDSCTDPLKVAYYQDLYDYVKRKPGDIDRVVLNPGAKVGDCYMAASDIIVTFENTYANYVGWQPSGWEATQPANHFWHLITETNKSDMPNAISLAKSRNAGWVYVTDDSGTNPWDSLPSYWNNELPLVSGS
jgi:hypothetical protein